MLPFAGRPINYKANVIAGEPAFSPIRLLG